MHTQELELAKIRRSESSDGELVQQALAGDERAFETLVDRYYTSLTNLIYQILRNHHQVDDVLQHVFLQLYLSLATLRADRSLKAWLFQVARNRCLDELRRRRTISFSDLQVQASERDESDFVPFEFLPDASPLPDELAEQHELRQGVLRAIQILPPKLRPVVFLRYSSQKSFSEIGHLLSIPEATAKTYYNRAKPFLRAALLEGQIASAC
jgi:RNA polymerase sigma factor (sigma-70 family)